MSIRLLLKEDLGALLELYSHLHQEDSPLPSLQQVERIWSEALGNNSIRYFGYHDAGLLVSSCTITVIPNLTRSCRPYAVIENVVTHREHRRRGYGKAVLQAALEFAWSADCYKVMLMTGRLDEDTFSFYESAGFRRNKKLAFVAEPDFQQSNSHGNSSKRPFP